MVASVADFTARFPEFASREVQNPGQIAATLAAIELRVSETYGARRDEVIYLELADTLSAGAQGRGARKQRDGDGQTIYAAKLAQMKSVHALGRRTA